jgi:CrcB protein
LGVRRNGNFTEGGKKPVETWTKVVALSIGGTLGVNARYWLGAWMNRWTSAQFPWATVTINITGSFLIGFLTVALARWLPHPNVRLLVITGFLGGYTTFSTFENDSLTLWERGEGRLMAANLVGSVAAGFAAVVLGTALARGLAEPAVGQAGTGIRRVGTTAVGYPHPTRRDGGPSISARIGILERVGDSRGTGGGWRQ